MGVGVVDKIDPSVELIKPLDQSVYSDADNRVEFSIHAEDFWGVDSYYLTVNDQRMQDYEVIGGTGFSISLLKEGVNQVWATAIDNYGNLGQSDTVNIYYIKTIKLINPIMNIDLFDTDSVYTLNLNTIFYDTFDSTSRFEYSRTVDDYSGKYNVSIIDSLLTINTFKYFSGSGKIIITASKDDGRNASIEIFLSIEQAEEYIRIRVPDDNFRKILRQYYNFTIDETYIIGNEVLSLDSLNLAFGYTIEDFEGLQNFKNITYLNISGHKIKNVDFTSLTNIKRLECNSCDFIEDIDFSPLLQLEELGALFNYFYLNLDVSNNLNLKKLSLSSNMETINLSNNTKLEYLYFEGMRKIDLSNNMKLKKIKILESQIMEINLENNIELNEVDFTRTGLTEVDLRNNQELISIKLNDNQLLVKTIVWELPLPSYIALEKDEHNVLVINP